MNHKAKAIELLGKREEHIAILTHADLLDEALTGKKAIGNRTVKDWVKYGKNQMHSKAVGVVVGLLEANEELVKKLSYLTPMGSEFTEFEECYNYIKRVIKEGREAKKQFVYKRRELQSFKNRLTVGNINKVVDKWFEWAEKYWAFKETIIRGLETSDGESCSYNTLIKSYLQPKLIQEIIKEVGI